MLSLAKLNRARVEYLERQLEPVAAREAAGADDYYTRGAESLGAWHGSAAATLGLAGERVERGQLARMLDGLHPGTGERLRRRVRDRFVPTPIVDPATGERRESVRRFAAVGGFDLTFGAPKSVSLAHALADEPVRCELAAAHAAAVHAALGVLDTEGCFVRTGRNGVRLERGGGVLVAVFDHQLAREVDHGGGARSIDPHLHTHCAVANTTTGPDGKWRTLSSRIVLSEYSRALGAVYQAQLRYEITRRLGWTWQPQRSNGLAELDGWDHGVLREFSQRRIQIETRLAVRDETGAVAAQRAAYATRLRKTDAHDLDATRDAWRARLAEHGLDQAALAGVLQPQRGVAPRLADDQAAALVARLLGPDGLTERRNTFTRGDVVRAAAEALLAGADATDVITLADRVVASADCLEAGERRYTSRDLATHEARIVDHALHTRQSGIARLHPRHANEAIAASDVRLNDEQAWAVRRVSCDGRGVEVVQAAAGTGKTTTLGVLATAYRDAGITVLGAAPTARAARELDAAGIPSCTLDRLRIALDHGARFQPGVVVVIDEAGMAGTRTLARIADAAAAAEAKLVLCGDSAQLAGVPASGAFARLSAALDSVRLDHNVRQRDPRDAAAIASLRADRLDPDAYLAHAASLGRLQIADDAHDAIDAARRWYARAIHAYGPDEIAVITRTNALRDELNTELRRYNPDLHGPEVAYGERSFQAGERIILRHNDRTTGATNGTRGRIVSISAETRELLVLTRGALRLPAAYVDAGHVQHAYALTAHNLQGATLDAACIVARPEDHSAEWAYTATSRARHSTTHIVIAGPDPDQPTRTRDLDQTMHALGEALRRSDAEPRPPAPPLQPRPRDTYEPRPRIDFGISRGRSLR